MRVAARLLPSLLLACSTRGGPPAATPNTAALADPTPAPAFQDPNRRAKIAAVFPRLDAQLANELATQELPGLAFGLVVDGELVYAKGLGVADLETRAPVDADTVFRIGSITKTFSSMAVLMLRDEGKLSLDDPAAATLPELAALRYPTRDSRPITVRDLLTHSAGLPQFGRFSHSRPGHDVTESELFGDLAHLEMPYAPGTQYFYSSFGASLLGPLVTRVSGVRYRDFVTQRIFAPLGMRSSFWVETDVPKGRLATGYVPGTAGPSRTTPWRLGAMEAAGGLYMSLRDLARWAAFQLAAYPPRNDADAGPLRRSSVREAHAAQRRIGLGILAHEPTPTRPSIVTARAGGVGLAWHVFESCELDTVVGHMGAIEGYSAGIELLPDRGVGLVSLSNYRDARHAGIMNRAREILLESKGIAPRTIPVSPALDRMVAGLLDLYAHFRDERYRQLAAPLYHDAISAAEMAHEADEVTKAHGVCRGATPVEVRSAWSGRFAAPCERGRVEIDVQIDADGRFTEVLIGSPDAPGSSGGKCPDRAAAQTPSR